MPLFTYQAIDQRGEKKHGTLAATSRATAIDRIVALGLHPTAVDEKSDHRESRRAKQGGSAGSSAAAPSARLSRAVIESFTRELADLLAAGVPLARALQIIQREARSGDAKELWISIYNDVVAGHPLASALARFPRSFVPVYIALVRAGETGGFLDKALSQIADFIAREQELKGKVKSALIYPAVLAVLATAVLIFLMIFFIPKFRIMFDEFGGSLPVLTQMILAAADILKTYGWFAALLVMLAVVGMRRLLASEAGRQCFQQIVLTTPMLGHIVARFALVRFAGMLGTLIGAGVPLLASLRVAKEAIGYETLDKTVDEAIEQVQQGESLASSLAGCPQLFPASVTEMIAVAEETGRLSHELVRMAGSYETHLDRQLRTLVALAEPAMLFFMAAAVGTIIIGMLLPIFTLQEYVK